MSTKTFSLSAAAGSLVLAAYWYASPYLALTGLKAAAAAHDADAFNEYVDYPKVRDSLKRQFAAEMATQLGPEDGASMSPDAAVGRLLAGAFVDKLVDALVRPEVVMRAMRAGKPSPDQDTRSAGGTPRAQGPEWEVTRVNANKLSVVPQVPGLPSQKQASFTLHRDGFASWKLTEIRFPPPGPSTGEPHP